MAEKLIDVVRRLMPPDHTAQDVRRLIDQRGDNYELATAPKRLRGVASSHEVRHGIDIYTLRPRRQVHQTRASAVYIHGGAYILDINLVTWRILASLVRETGATFDVVVYPLAPQATADSTVDAVASVVSDAVMTSPNVVLMGDSAGAGLALAVAIELRERGLNQPAGLVLISPWLDVTMTHPEQPSLQSCDHVLGIESLAECGRQYAGDLEVTDRRASPLLADLSGLAPMTVFHGTHDILVVDSRRLHDRAKAAGVDIEYTESPGMSHIYFALTLLPEARRDRRTVANLISRAGPK